MVDNVVVGFEHTIREPVIAHELPEVFYRIEFGRARRQWQDGNVARHDQVLRQMPASLIHDEDSMRIVVNMSGDFGQVLVHGIGVAPRHDEGCGFSVPGADRAEDVCRASALVVWSRRSRSTLGPAACDLVLLPDPGFVLEPDFDHSAFGGSPGDFRHCGGEVFLNVSAASASCA